MSKRINPALLLAAAKRARPLPNNSNSSWGISDGSHGKIIEYIVVDIDGYISEHEEFNPLHNDSDARALERALKKDGWVFDGANVFTAGDTSPTTIYRAQKINSKFLNESDAMLLLECFSAQTGIELYEQESAS
jgi:hypothetical protein